MARKQAMTQPATGPATAPSTQPADGLSTRGARVGGLDEAPFRQVRRCDFWTGWWYDHGESYSGKTAAGSFELGYLDEVKGRSAVAVRHNISAPCRLLLMDDKQQWHSGTAGETQPAGGPAIVRQVFLFENLPIDSVKSVSSASVSLV